MRYVSKVTTKGNSSYSYESQDAANKNAEFLDENGCTDCTYCTDCTDCTRCTSCTYCTRCTRCTDCTSCTSCTSCTYCTSCTDCTRCTRCTSCTSCTSCTYCTSCTDCTRCTRCTSCTYCTGALRWDGPPAASLVSLNGLKWSISTDGGNIQIGCQQHSRLEWDRFSDQDINVMSEGALQFWAEFKPTILSLATARAATGGISC